MRYSLRSVTLEQRKLLWSLGTNGLSRIPGMVGLLWFLPLLHSGLGTDRYARLLAAIALGNAVSFLFGGYSLIGRRLIGEAYAVSDRTGEANGFISLVAANSLALGLAAGCIAVYCWGQNATAAVWIVAMLASLGGFLNTFDNIRSAYNEHYVTASLQFGLQIVIYAIGFAVPAMRQSLVWAALVLQSNYMLASLITMALLLRDRPYLITGQPRAIWQVIRQGTILALADGFVMTTLSLSVVWLQATASAPIAAWFATIVRLFQTFLVPVILLLLPLSSYVRILWNGKSLAQQQRFTKITLLIGLGYGAVAAAILMLLSSFYADLLHLPAPSESWRVVPTFLLFGAIIAYKSYSSIAYLVLETASLATWTTGVLGVAAALGAVASLVVNPLDAINVYALAAAVSMIFVLFRSAARFTRSLQVSNMRVNNVA